MEHIFSDGYGIFPNVNEADENGLLAIGAQLVPDRLIYAYENGIFPWYSEEDPICWYCPSERFVIFPKDIKVSKSMKTFIRNPSITITYNQDFEAVIQHCAHIRRKDQDGTWIHEEMIVAYSELHQMGYAQSVEVWKDNNLIGGLYGIVIDNVFCGESMFSLQANASKAALIHLAKSGIFELIDCQLHTTHLKSMGAISISRVDFLEILSRQKKNYKNILGN